MKKIVVIFLLLAMQFQLRALTVYSQVPVVAGDTLDSLCTGPNLIFNGDFSSGNTGFYCGLNFSTVYNPGNYYVAPTYFLTSYSYGDHTPTPDEMFMSVDGSTTLNVLWEQTIPVIEPDSDYIFTFWGTEGDFNLPMMEIHMIGNITGDQVIDTLPGVVLSGSSTWVWNQYRMPFWNAGLNSSVTIRIMNLQLNGYGDDFGLDDFSFRQVCSHRPVNEPVNPCAEGILPNIFTPNNDRINDVFTISSCEGSIKIYNRWGQLVFSAGSLADSWNGKIMNTGTEAPDGTYYYLITRAGKTQTGFVTLQR